MWLEESQKKVIDPKNVENFVKDLKASKKTIATLNGSFDLVHAGHLHIIYEASLQADVLIIALNSDQSIREYKSPSRPIISLQYRLQMMTALFFVDYVTWFEETDPLNILEKIKPDVHVNGSEYGKDCIEADLVKKYGGKIHVVSLLDGLSTSQILGKIKQCVS